MHTPNTRFHASLILCAALATAHCQASPSLVNTGGETDAFTNPVLYGGKAAFFAGMQNGYTPTIVAEADGSTVTELVNFSTPHPSNPAMRFSAFYNIAGDEDNLYFSANSNLLFSGSYGLFKYDGQELVALVPDASELPPQKAFTGLSGVKAGGGKVVFHIRQGQTYEGYFLHDGDEVTLIADSHTAVAEGSGGLLELPTVGAAISANGEHIILRVKTALAAGTGQPDQYTIYRYVDGSLSAIAELGDSIGDGFTIGNMPTQPIVLNDGSVLVNVHTTPSGQALVVISPDNIASIVPLPEPSDGNRISLSGVSAGADDGEWVYGLLSTYTSTYTLVGHKAVRYSAEGTFEDLFDVPFEANGETWVETNFQFVSANPEGYLALVQNEAGDRRLFTNIDSLSSTSGPIDGESLWKDSEDFAGWKASTALGWIYDELFPHVYSATLNGWIFVSGSSLESYHFFSFADDSWYWTTENYFGWVYRYSGGGEDPGWFFIL